MELNDQDGDGGHVWASWWYEVQRPSNWSGLTKKVMRAVAKNRTGPVVGCDWGIRIYKRIRIYKQVSLRHTQFVLSTSWPFSDKILCNEVARSYETITNNPRMAVEFHEIPFRLNGRLCENPDGLVPFFLYQNALTEIVTRIHNYIHAFLLP